MNSYFLIFNSFTYSASFSSILTLIFIVSGTVTITFVLFVLIFISHYSCTYLSYSISLRRHFLTLTRHRPQRHILKFLYSGIFSVLPNFFNFRRNSVITSSIQVEKLITLAYLEPSFLFIGMYFLLSLYNFTSMRLHLIPTYSFFQLCQKCPQCPRMRCISYFNRICFLYYLLCIHKALYVFFLNPLNHLFSSFRTSLMRQYCSVPISLQTLFFNVGTISPV